MSSFLKFLEDNCPGDDAHNGYAEPNKPLLERCGLCREIYEAHLEEVEEWQRYYLKIIHNDRRVPCVFHYEIAGLRHPCHLDFGHKGRCEHHISRDMVTSWHPTQEEKTAAMAKIAAEARGKA
jgi:hypothetical protein